MTVKELKLLLEKEPEDARVAIEWEGAFDYAKSVERWNPQIGRVGDDVLVVVKGESA